MPEKIKKKIVKKQRILIYIFIIFAVSAFAFNMLLDSNDELWNFSNIYKMSNGYIIYKDLNVIVTPLFFYIGQIIFKIFGSNYFSFRLYNVAIFTAFYILIYEIFRKLKIKEKSNLVYLILIYILTCVLILNGANYNILAIDICLAGILCMLKQKNKCIQSIIIFLIFMTKQNIGIYYCMGYILYNFIQTKNIIKTIKKSAPTLIITIGLLAIYLIYLASNQNLYNFVNYAFLGIGEFKGKNISFDLSMCIFILVVLIYPIMIWICKSKNILIKKEYTNQAQLLMCFSAPILLSAYPLANTFHIIISIIMTIITFIFIIEKGFLEELSSGKVTSRTIKIMDTIFIILIVTFSLYENINYMIKFKNNNYYEAYYGAIIDEDLKNNINNIIGYIKQNEEKGYNVKILSYKSNLYMNILKKNNKNMDLPFYGNLGKEGEDGLIEEIKKLEDTKLLITKQEDNKFQESKKVRDYCLNNYEKIGEIEEFFIYKIGY